MTAAPPRPRSGLTDSHQWRLWLSGLVGSRYDGLTHFGVVEPGVLLRCGQPRVRDLVHICREHGLRTVVCARGGTRHPLRGRWFGKERAYCEEAGIGFVHLPFSDDATPPGDVLDRFLAIVGQPERRPVLVHCEQGFHRTGILCAAYRIRVGGWPVERALEELRAWGFDMERARCRPLMDALLTWAGAGR
jgi:protein tyrosine/serine phosphatase